MGTPESVMLEQLERFGAEVMPAFRPAPVESAAA
jgi:hypothetical protein